MIYKDDPRYEAEKLKREAEELNAFPNALGGNPYFLPVKCFARGTPVLCPDGLRPIETIQEGDRVLAYDLGRERFLETRVLRCDRFEGEFDVLDVQISDEDRFSVTTEHAFYTGHEWVASKDVGTKGPILASSGKRLFVSTTAPRRCPGTTTYNLRTEHETYLVGRAGLVVSDRNVLR